MTRKFAFPKLRIARMRPAVVVSTRVASSVVVAPGAVRLDEFGDGVRAREDVRIRLHAEALQLLEVRPPLADLFGFLLLLCLLGIFSHRHS